MNQILTLFFNPFAGPSGINFLAVVIYIAIAALVLLVWLERKYK